jgi:hypothetical protein
MAGLRVSFQRAMERLISFQHFHLLVTITYLLSRNVYILYYMCVWCCVCVECSNVYIGYGCDSDIECVWHNSCTSGRDVSVPFCGACLGGYSEVYGSAKCVPSTQVSNCLSE